MKNQQVSFKQKIISSSYQNENDQSDKIFPRLLINQNISKQQLSCSDGTKKLHIQLLVYNYLQSPSLEQFLQQSLDYDSQLYLTKKSQIITQVKEQKQQQQIQYYLLYMMNENIKIQQNNKLKFIITVLVSLCDKVVLFDLDNQKQAFIEKIFFDSVSSCQKIKWLYFQHYHKLTMIRECYSDQNKKFNHKKQSKSAQFNKKYAQQSGNMLQYFGRLKQYSQYLQTQKDKYKSVMNNLRIQRSKYYIQQLLKANKVIKRVSLDQIVKIYLKVGQLFIKKLNNQNKVINKIKNKQLKISQDQEYKINMQQPWIIRYSLQKMYELESKSRFYQILQYQIFHSSFQSKYSVQFARKQIIKYITSSSSSTIYQRYYFHQHNNFLQQKQPIFIPLTSHQKQQLQWKIKRLTKYQKQLLQQSKYSPQKCQNKYFYELSDEQISMWIEKYQHIWLRKCFERLKQLFGKIAHVKDAKAIQEYRNQCFKVQQRLQNVNVQRFQMKKTVMLKEIRLQLRNFIIYHEDVIMNKRFSGINYVIKETVFQLKHQPKVRNKLLLFVLILILAFLQSNVILGMTIGTIAFISLAIRL